MFRPTILSTGGGAIVVAQQHIFADTNERDIYFITNPSELVENLYIYITTMSALQQYKEPAWVNMSPVIVGEDGKTWYNGAGSPSVELGVDGDFYLDVTSSEYYGPKNTVWGSGVSLIGPAGNDGVSLTIAVQDEPPTSPVDGDLWADTNETTYIAPHASSHASGSEDELTPSDIGAAFATHEHVISDITDLDISEFATVDHTHLVIDITDLNVSEFATVDHLHTGVYEPASANIQSHIIAINNPHAVTVEQIGAASKSDTTVTYYVYEDATGDEDGSSKVNGFKSLQAAIDTIPDISNDVTIIVSKGSTNYLGDITTIQKASVKSLTIQGEFYANESCDANAVAGKIVDASADFSDFEVGDRVVCTKYSGTVGSSSIEDYFYATVTEIGEGYVQTSEETKVPTTGWKYLINQTVFDGDASSSAIISTRNLTSITGICIYNQAGIGVNVVYGIDAHINGCILYDMQYDIISNIGTTTYLYYSALFCKSAGMCIGRGRTASTSSYNCIFVGLGSSTGYGLGLYDDISNQDYIKNCGFFNLQYAINNPNSALISNCATSYIASNVTYGAYGYNITLVSCSNNATTPVTNLTSGGSIEQWDGYDLPSVEAATGEQVLRLNSGKTALEFATVTSGSAGMSPFFASLVFGRN